jgi:MFS family permease
MKGAIFRGFSINSRQFFLIFFLIFNSVIWFFTILFFIAWDEADMWLLPAATTISFLIGPLIAERVSRMRFLLIWVLLGVISSLISLIMPTFVVFVFWGFAFGIGFPSCLALVSSLTKVEERGRICGIIFFAIYAILPLFGLTIGSLDILSSSIPLAVWRVLSFLPLFLLKVDLDAPLKPVTYSSVLSNKKFLFYFFPWLVFGLVHFLTWPIIDKFFGESFMMSLTMFEGVLGSLLCFIGGSLMDFWGRRRPILIGFVMLGIGFATLSFLTGIPAARGFYIAADGIAWGIFSVAFGPVVWGDIADHQRSEKFYGLGSTPISLALIFAGAASASAWLKTLNVSNVFSLASFFLFLAVIPIFFAPELLPEKVTKEREIKKYMEEVKKIAGRE